MEQQNHQAAPHTAQAGHGAPQTPSGSPRRVRRVGTVAFALTLIGVGVLLLVRVFVPGFDVLSVLKFAPVILIILGVEVLIYSARPDVTLRYDFLSMFVCFLLLVAAAGSNVVCALIDGYGPTHEYTEYRIKSELEQKAYDALSPLGTVRDLSVSVTLHRPISAEEAAAATITSTDEAGVYVTFAHSYDSQMAFAQDCRRIIDAAEAAGLPFTDYTFDTFWENGKMPDLSRSYYLSIGSRWGLDRTAEELAMDVDEDIWYAGDCFDGEADLQEYLDQFDIEMGDLFPATGESAATDGAPAGSEEPVVIESA